MAAAYPNFTLQCNQRSTEHFKNEIAYYKFYIIFTKLKMADPIWLLQSTKFIIDLLKCLYQRKTDPCEGLTLFYQSFSPLLFAISYENSGFYDDFLKGHCVLLVPIFFNYFLRFLYLVFLRIHFCGHFFTATILILL